MKDKKYYYAVRIGREGQRIYDSWEKVSSIFINENQVLFINLHGSAARTLVTSPSCDITDIIPQYLEFKQSRF